MTKAKSPEMSIIAGCFYSLTHILCHFDRAAFPEQVTTIFNCLAKAIDPSIKTTRFDVPKGALELLAKRGEQFRGQLLSGYKDIYARLLEFSRSKNNEVRKATASAIETFLRQVGLELVDPMDETVSEERRTEIFNYFLKDFMALMRANDSTLGSVSRAIRSYGYFAAAFRKFQGEEKVRDMLVLLLEKCFQVCVTDEETSESKGAFLPSFLQSLASIIKETTMVDESVAEPLKVIFVFTLEFYPKLTGALQESCSYAIGQFLYTVAAIKQRPVKLVSELLYQLLLQSCMHAPVVEGERAASYTEGTEVVSYKSFTSLWIHILTLSQEQKRRIGITGISDLKSYIYGETIEALLHMCKKLQLTINLEQDETDEDLPKSDSGKKNETVKVKDFQHLINLADFMKTVLEETETSYFNQWAYVFCHTIIRLSYQNPVVSSLYRLLTSAMTICNANDYFDKPITEEEGDTMDILSESSGAAVSATTQLISKYHRKVVISMKQYKDELLISCLKFIFSLPKCILQTNAEATAEALQIGLSLGLSYPPLIGECLPILRLMPSILREDDLVKQLKVLLPYLDKFLQHTDHVEQGKGEETPKVLKNKQRLRLPPSLLRMAHQKTQSERTEVQRLKLEVLKFLGELGGDRNRYMIDTDRRSQAKLAVSWDTNSHLLFDLPFQEMKVEIYLDAFLPRACELARTSSNRQTKVAACELVHSLAILLLGRSVPQDDAIEKLKSTDKLYQKLFPVILNLAVDVEQVTKQLFEPLMVQLIHWFTRFPKRKETSLLLDTLMDGVETMNNSALREFSAKCIAEFLRWSIKQTSVEQQKKNPENVKQLLRQMYSMARHPSSSRRLGACNVYNHIYRILREEESLVDQFTMEILVCFMECLALAHGDDSSLGTQKEAQKCLEHVERILKTKSAIFNLPSKRRRIPLGWTNATLKEAVLWLLERVGRHETECRHACMRLIVSLTTALPQELNTKRKLMEHVIAKNGVQYIKDRCEAVPLHKDRCVGLVQLSQDIRLSSAVTLKSLTRWFESILASLDSYCWLIGNDMISASTLFTGKEEIFSILMHFVEKVAMKSLQETLEVDSEVNKKDLRVYTPVETDEYNRCKCTVTVRLLDFLTVLISKGKQVLGQSKLLTGEIWKMISLCIFEPVAVGFNMADIEVLSNLPEILKSLLQVILRFLDSKVAEDFYKTLMNLTGSLGSYDLGHMIATLDLNSTEEHLLSMTHLANGYQLLSDVKLLAKCFASDLTEFSSQLAEAVVKGSRISAIEPAGKHLLESVYGLALSIGLPDSLILNSLYSPDGRAVYACIDTVLHKHITMNSPNLVQLMLEKARLDPHQKASYVIGLLDYMSTSTYLLDKIKQTVVKKIWDGWADLRCWWSGDTANQTTVSYCLHILKKSFLIDTTIEKHPRYSLMIDLFKTTLSSKQTELSQKYDLLDMLPAFLKGSSEQRKSVRDAVQAYVDERFPISSREFPINSSGYHDYITMFKKILEAMVLSGDIELLKVVLSVLCREETHADEKLIQEYIDRFANRLRKLRSSNLLDALTLCFNMFINSSTYPNQTCRVAALTRCCLPILSRTDRATVIDFFKNILGDIKTLLQTRESKAIPEAFEVVIKDKICCYELIEFMYSGLLKDEVFSPSSILAKGWVSNDPTSAAKADAWKTMTKDLIRCMMIHGKYLQS
ncbi:DNA-dependent protein kinase catalytic subunit-like [Watersipora subatra]|uniref:DNA-dependent protein kinase catalytic subunit-like n=1 Tax=Watersipora subatra TaxID=2589382 RepID=UPI00355BE134